MPCQRFSILWILVAGNLAGEALTGGYDSVGELQVHLIPAAVMAGPHRRRQPPGGAAPEHL